MSFHLRTAVSNILRNAGINILTVFSISVGLFLIGLTAYTVTVLEGATRAWTEGFGLVVYLEDGVHPAAVGELKTRITQEPSVKKVRFVSRDSAMANLREVLGSELLTGLPENPLPDSLEVSFHPDGLDPAKVRSFAGRVKNFEGVEDVQYGERWVETMARTVRRFSWFGALLAISLAMGIVFILSNTIKILFYRRSGEIEILKLLGATRWFVRAPFLIEGTFFGLLSGLMAAAFLYGALLWLDPGYHLPIRLPVPLPLALAGVTGGGAALGILASLAALGRVRL